MAEQSTDNQTRPEPPGVNEVHQRAREAVEALRAVRDELKRRAAAMEVRQGELETMHAECENARAGIDRDREALKQEREKFAAECQSNESRLKVRETELAELEQRLATVQAEKPAARTEPAPTKTPPAPERVIEPSLVEAPRQAVEAKPAKRSTGPKTAASNGAADSRKLRRNTKRKAIGI